MNELTRNRDRAVVAFLVFVFIYVVLATMDVVLAQSTQEVINAQIHGQIDLINYRLDKIETLMYTAIAGTGGNLLAHMAEIRNRRKLRTENDADDLAGRPRHRR